MGSTWDLLIRNAKVVDGTGSPWFHGDVALLGDRIAAVAPVNLLSASNARETLDAGGKVVAPGFIDLQSHAIISLMREPLCVSKITQGVTTEIMGETWVPAPQGGKCNPLPDEWAEKAKGWTRFRHWFDALLDRGVSPNVGSFMAAGTLRSLVMGMRMDAPTADEMQAMKAIMTACMQDGAFGISYALIYPPDTYTQTEEVVEIARVAGEFGGLYITHMRSEGSGILEGVEEALDIGRRAALPVEIYHLKAAGQDNWGKMPAVIEKIDAARSEGQDITACMYPYVASGTDLSAILPKWAHADGKLFENLSNAETRRRIHKEMSGSNPESRELASRAESIMPVGMGLEEHRPYVGKRLSEIAASRGQDWINTAMDLLAREEKRIFTIYFSMNEDNLHLQLKQPWIKIASDAGSCDPRTKIPDNPTHPRGYGTFPRVLGHYVRDLGVLTLEDAVRKMTGAVANRLGLIDRGYLRPGCFADIVLFDPQTVSDRATFEDSHQLSVGIEEVWVNGQRVVSGAAPTGAKPGRFVGGPGVNVK